MMKGFSSLLCRSRPRFFANIKLCQAISESDMARLLTLYNSKKVEMNSLDEEDDHYSDKKVSQLKIQRPKYKGFLNSKKNSAICQPNLKI